MRATKTLGVVLLLACSCLNPDDIFPLSGTVETPGQHVTLERGTRATVDECGEDFVRFKETDADANGAYTFEIFRAQAQSLTTGLPFCFRVGTTYASGTRTWAVTKNVVSSFEFPQLPDWRAGWFGEVSTTLFPDGGMETSVSYDLLPIAYPAPEDVGFLDRYSMELAGADGVVQWRQGDSIVVSETLQVVRNPLDADPRILREFDGGTLRASASYNRATQFIEALSGDVRTLWSPTISASAGDTHFIDGPALTPPSRGATCDGYVDCPFTDGVLAPVAVSSSAITLHFAQPISPRLVVLRGVVTEFIERLDDQPRLPDGVTLAAFDADGGSVGPEPGLGGVLASANFVHDFDGVPLRPDGGVPEYPPTYLAIPVKTSAPISSLRLMMPALRVDEISVWPGGYTVR